jgi:hypothetical protein
MASLVEDVYCIVYTTCCSLTAKRYVIDLFTRLFLEQRVCGRAWPRLATRLV